MKDVRILTLASRQSQEADVGGNMRHWPASRCLVFYTIAEPRHSYSSRGLYPGRPRSHGDAPVSSITSMLVSIITSNF